MSTEMTAVARETLPLLPLKGTIVFPHQAQGLGVGRPKSLRALEAALGAEGEKLILLVAQRQDDIEDPTPDDIHRVGTVCRILQVGKQPDGVLQVIVEGVVRAEILEYLHTEPYFAVRIAARPDVVERSLEVEALVRGLSASFERFARLSRAVPPDQFVTIMQAEEPGRLADLVAQHLNLKLEERQELLEAPPQERLEKLGQLLSREISILELERKIQNRVRKQMEKSQREYFLKEQMKAIQQELGESDERQAEAAEYRKKIEAANLPAHVKEKALEELARLEKMPPMVAEAVVVRTYLDWILAIPWSVTTEDRLDIDEARRILDEDHYGLTKAKERVIEYLAVRKLARESKGPILCFVGPPGVGKTSLGKSIARALGRKFVRVSLGGVRDEAEIRGHRRTYVGALPGRIVQGLKQAGSRNPVFMLDEIDKLGVDFRGDPSAALLEALDPEQNHAFSDHYLELALDLSEVMWITTANILDTVPPALRDRMEVIRFPGYTEEEKVRIAEQFLIPKQRKATGLTEQHVQFTEAALRRIVREYTREAGVRNLEREIGTICRKVATEVARGSTRQVRVTVATLHKFLGPPRFRFGSLEKEDEVGVATGLVYTEMGGDVTSVEATLMPGEGKLILTGQLGEVMKESGQAALSYVRSRARRLGLPEDFYRKLDVHIHVPAGAQPKEGPSAGITMATALASALTGRPVRRDVAMTGEITLRGRVLPIGGVKEKVLAAHRAGIRTVILPKENEKDLHEIPANVRRALRIVLVDHMDQVLAEAFAPAPAQAQVPGMTTIPAAAYRPIPQPEAIRQPEPPPVS
ncbi:MAG: endopeptidase La [Armatimonadota bacterium]|nr:endopeptidase La [Armatimonadota bacterium]MDR7448383.1 endopeptidase La [Armatimonadota bacterium]MDR7459783.1 endopeptidase La [Armatimonadota bacterium]MDR7479254.1 endopeptidase La [Armatimonadota bacterium]MDR7501075.1 endopeptidase La [Armatimonadota bacterium]